MTAMSATVLAAVVARWWASRSSRRRARLRAIPEVGHASGGRRAWGLVLARSARRDTRHLEGDLPRLADALARDVRAGSTVTVALTGTVGVARGVLATDLAGVERALDAGSSLTDALTEWSDRRRSPALDQFVGTVILGADLGGRAAPALDATAASLRDQSDVRDEVRALATQSRASAALLTGLPPLAATGLAFIEPATARFLLGTAAGVACLCLATLLVGAGWWWMDRLCGSGR